LSLQVTGEVLPSNLDIYKKSGATDVFVKPLDIELLLDYFEN
jgi:hypothetical protein